MRQIALLRLASAGLALSAVAGIYRGVHVHRIYTANIPEELAQLRGMLELVAGVELAALLMISGGVFGVAAALGRLGRAVAIGWGGMLALRLLWSALAFAPHSDGLRAFVQQIPWPTYLAFEVAFQVGLLLLLTRGAKGGAQVLGGIAALLALTSWSWTVVGRMDALPEALSGPDRIVLGALIHNLCELLFAAVVFALAQQIGADAPDGATRDAPAAAGLRLFRSALVLRLVVLIGVVIVTVASGAARSLGGMKLALYGGTGLSLALGATMVAGLGRYALSIRAGAAAGLGAAVALGASLVVDGWTLTILGDLFAGRVDAAQASLSWAQAASQGLGIVGMLAVLGSLGGVAHALEEGFLVERARRLSVSVVVLFLGALAVRLFAQARGVPAAAVVVGGGAVLVLALYVFVRLVGLVGAVATALDSAAEGRTR